MTTPQYGPAHRRERERWRKIVEAGDAFCVECLRPIEPDDPSWHLAHDHTRPDDPHAYLGAAHGRHNIGERNTRVARENRQGQPHYWSRQWLPRGWEP